MVQWNRLFTETSHLYRSEVEHRTSLPSTPPPPSLCSPLTILKVLPTHNSEPLPSAIPPAEVTKVALRLKYQIERVIPYELEEWKITRANSAVITRKVEQTAKEAGGEEYGACVVFGLLVCKRWFVSQSVLELWDAGLYGCRAVACEVLAKRMSVDLSISERAALLCVHELRRVSEFICYDYAYGRNADRRPR